MPAGSVVPFGASAAWVVHHVACSVPTSKPIMQDLSGNATNGSAGQTIIYGRVVADRDAQWPLAGYFYIRSLS